MDKTIDKLISSIPEEFIKRQIHMAGDSSTKWFEDMPRILEHVMTSWELEHVSLVNERSFNNVVLFAHSPKYGEVVVKIGHPAYELFDYEPEALKIYDGQDACQFFALDSRNRVMLLERLTPGDYLAKRTDRKERIFIACQLLRKINKTVIDETAFPSYEDMVFDYFRRAKAITKNKELIDLIQEAQLVFSAMLSQGYKKVLNHGDFHYRNILQSGNAYRVIDPKGMIGFEFMDTAQIIKSEMELIHGGWDITNINPILNLVSEYTGYATELLAKWMFVVSVWRLAGDVIYIKSNSRRMNEKIKQSKYLFQLF